MLIRITGSSSTKQAGIAGFSYRASFKYYIKDHQQMSLFL